MTDTLTPPAESLPPPLRRPDSTRTVWPFVIAGCTLVGIALVANEWVLGAWLAEQGRVTNAFSRVTLALFDGVVFTVGVTLLVRRERAPWREMLLACGAVVVALALAEGGLRLWFVVRNAASPAGRELAAGLGWRPVPHATFDQDVPGFGPVRYTTTTGGFRVFGDPHSPKRKLLILGDSFTEAATVSDGEAYYHRLADARPDLEVFAIGAGGYGTLQEYLLLDEWRDTIRPDFVLLQMHPNDLINNSHALESRSATNNNQMTRPYWEQGRVVSRFPENAAWGPVYNLARRSYLLRLANLNLHVLRSRRGNEEDGMTSADPDVGAATETTVELLSMVRRRAAVPVFAFSVRSETYLPFWSRADACARAGVQFVPGVGERVDAAVERGEPVTGAPIDSHWNARGHQLAADVLLEWMAQAVPPRQSPSQ